MERQTYEKTDIWRDRHMESNMDKEKGRPTEKFALKYVYF
jgi:hypothetical protein